MTTPTVKTKTVENGLIAVYTALTLNLRPDGTNYRAVSELHPDREVVQEIVRELHEEEIPNDWRYQMTYDLAASLAECSEGQSEEWDVEDYYDYILDLARNFSDDGTGDLLEWVKTGSRIEFDDALQGAIGMSIVELLKLRQEEEIALMGYSLLALVKEKLT